MDQASLPLIEALDAYRRKNPAYFRIPGHRGARGVNPVLVERFGADVFSYDLTETPLTDDLHLPEGVIAAAQALAAEAFGAERSFFLVNGTTCGVEAMILSAVDPGETILVARNAHKSALMGVILAGARPAWLMPDTLTPWDLSGAVTPAAVEQALVEHPGARAVLLVSPTYYGLCADVAGIAAVCHRYAAVLLVDEAHGAHLCFSDALPPGALSQGADLCTQSIHKTAGSFTQSSMLHLRSARIDPARVARALQLVQSTSPSYLLMASLDAARQELALRGEGAAARALTLARGAAACLAQYPGVSVLGRAVVGQAGIAALDETRLTFTACARGLTGIALQRRLFELGVDTELADHRNVMALVTGGNTDEDLKRLCDAVRAATARPAGAPLHPVPPLPAFPPQAMPPREAFFAASRAVCWTASIGCVAAESVAPYPPGIPILCPGEVVTEEIVRYVDGCRRDGIPLHGLSDQTLTTIRVVAT